MMSNPSGLCQCGCGEATALARYTDPKYGRVIGEPCRFRSGHSSRKKDATDRYKSKVGYRFLRMPDHPRASMSGLVMEHIIVAERALGKPLSGRHQVHHWNEDKADNRPKNLLICEDAAYHQLIHQRARALAESGHADWRKCVICKKYSPPAEICITSRSKRPNGTRAVHRECGNALRAQSKRKKRAAARGINLAIEEGK